MPRPATKKIIPLIGKPQCRNTGPAVIAIVEIRARANSVARVLGPAPCLPRMRTAHGSDGIADASRSGRWVRRGEGRER